jgi:ubiquinone/menaquinone biosynthesis C-methylase UbiE/uncharacterized protein YbaR (Trm112 family)
MRRQIIDLLRSPISGGPLVLEVFEETDNEVLEGRLADPASGVWFRIANGIADLVPLELRSHDQYAAFALRHGGSERRPTPATSDSTAVEDQKKQIAFFDRYHQKYEAEVVNSPYYLVLDRISLGRWARRSLKRGSRVLEIGCGSGRQTLPLAKLGVDVVALDLSESMLELARTKLASAGCADRADFIAASAEKMPICDSYFDGCIIYGSLHHFADPPEVLRKAAAALRPGGCFYMLEPHNSPVRFIFDWLMRVRPLWEEEAADEPLFDEAQLRGWLEPHRIRCRIRFSTYLPPHLFYRIGSRMGELLLSGSDRVLSTLPGIRRFAGVIIVEGIKAGRPAEQPEVHTDELPTGVSARGSTS